ncbi:MAG: DUF2911 domain-containing protein [Flavobacteriaceae bacterium]|nr:DUF2911 domain-containing protein [Flavobacteriaceae bacterium]
MKKLFLTLGILIVFVFQNQLYAQKFDHLDQAPIDIAYLRKNNSSKPMVKVVYGRPIKIDDTVFGSQVPYGEIWRTGSNEATEIKFYKDMKFGNKLVKAGTYILHTIPGEKEWTIILNSNTDTWGSFFYDASKDVVRIKVPIKQAKELDVFSIAFRKNFNNTYMVLAWDSTQIDIPLATQGDILAEL